MNTSLYIPQGSLAKDDFDLATLLDMKGISSGPHIIKVEMFELWQSKEKLWTADKELRIDYVPIRREDRLVKVPIVKHVAGSEFIILSDSDRGIYYQLEEDIKRGQTGKKDEW